jgi:transcriptional regulator with XRE-family HTH domain
MTTSASAPLVQFVKQWLRDHGYSQLALAQKAGIPHTTIGALLNHGVVPRPTTLKKIGGVMGVPVGRLMVLAGHISQDEYDNPIRSTDLARLYEVGDLSDDEWEQVRDFARYVRGKRRHAE